MQENIKIIETDKSPPAVGPYSQGVIVKAAVPLIFVSGQLPVDTHGALISGEIGILTERILESIQGILLSANSHLDDVVRVEIFCIDLKKDFPAINAVYARYFQGPIKPARQTVQVAALPLGSPIEISCIAVSHI